MALIDYFLIFASGLIMAAAVLLLLEKAVSKYNILNSKEAPLTGGISIGISFAVVSLFVFSVLGVFSRETTGIVLSSCLMLVFGVMDDLWELSVFWKFLVQVIASLVLVSFNVRTHIVFIPEFLNVIITVIWVVGITNALNHLDVMDGLAAGVSIIVAFSFCAISCMHYDRNIVILSLVLTGATAAFLAQNLPPAKIYLGNAGSHFLGFVLAALALSVSYADLNNEIALFSPVLILGLPIFDTAFVILMRLKQGRSIVRKSNDHFALRLLKTGFTKHKSLSYMLCLSLLFSFTGVLLVISSNLLGIFLILGLILMSMVLIDDLGKVAIDG